MKVIFLDIDGVLNGYNCINIFIYTIAKKLGLLKTLKKHHDIFGIRTYRVFLLYLLVKLTNAKIVLTSSWRKGWYNDTGKRTKELRRKLIKFNLNIYGITPDICSRSSIIDRGDEIQFWLDHSAVPVKSFVIFDDERVSNISDFGYRFILTRDKKVKIIMGRNCSSTGLRLMHVIKAIKILNKED